MNTDRDTHVEAELDRLTPATHEAREWDDVLLRAGAGHRHRPLLGRLLPAAGVAGLVVVLGILLVQSGDQSGPDTPALPASMPDGFTNVLQREQTDRDRTSAIGEAFDSAPGIDPDSIRFLGSPQGSDYFIGTRRDGSLCLIDAGAQLTACPGPAADPERLAGWMIVRDESAGKRIAAGLAPSRFQTARDFLSVQEGNMAEAPIVNGLWVVVDVRPDPIIELYADQDAAWTHISDPPPTSLQQRPQGSRDVLPGALLETANEGRDLLPVSPTTVRYAGRFNGEEAWVSGDGLGPCLHVTPDQSECAGELSISIGAAVFDMAPGGHPTFSEKRHWNRDLAGIADDGYATATVGDETVSITNNVFVFDGRPRGDRLILNGAAGTMAIDLVVDGTTP